MNHKILVNVLTDEQIRCYFAAQGLRTKYSIASGLARQFPELSWKLPGPRKAYQSESIAMLVFDALANGVAFLGGDAADERLEN